MDGRRGAGLRVTLPALAALLLQTAGVGAPTSQHLRWQREIPVPAGNGPVCVALDATVLAHAASRSGDDLRVFREGTAGEVEVPFWLTESEAEPEDAAIAPVRNAVLRGDEVDFDLEMPRRTYSSVDLKIAAKDFVGRAMVTAGGRALGIFAVFDLSGEGLARSTTLALAETTLPELHVSLRMKGLRGQAMEISPGMVQGAEVPVSREAQTLYTVVASTKVLHQKGGSWSNAEEMRVPAHVPVERVSFVLDAAFRGEFKREVSVGGSRLGNTGSGGIGAEEVLEGAIWRVGRQGADAEKLSVDAVMGLTMRDPARIMVAVHNVVDHRVLPALPIREVRLEMRQRSVCFDVAAGMSYLLRYGDAGLVAPVYKKMMPMSAIAVAALGPETVNAGFHPEPDRVRTPLLRVGVAWLLGVGGLVVIWASAGSLIRRRERS